MSLIQYAIERGIITEDRVSIFTRFKDHSINYLGKPAVIFHTRDIFTASFASNENDDLTQDKNMVTLALMQEVGYVNIAQMTLAQADSFYALCAQWIEHSINEHSERGQRLPLPVVYNMSEDRLERGNVRTAPFVPVVVQWTNKDNIIVRYGTKLYGISTLGNVAQL